MMRGRETRSNMVGGCEDGSDIRPDGANAFK